MMGGPYLQRRARSRVEVSQAIVLVKVSSAMEAIFPDQLQLIIGCSFWTTGWLFLVVWLSLGAGLFVTVIVLLVCCHQWDKMFDAEKVAELMKCPYMEAKWIFLAVGVGLRLVFAANVVFTAFALRRWDRYGPRLTRARAALLGRSNPAPEARGWQCCIQ
ncbi:hypothetical protein OESDEN_06373 [Oesophagostomum dentatum]|uniref:Uncharacterized protein n=1 Tax=Oesophagostomum dentatum TaxID=61180 RepID=A0A0B1TC87_OESDE|nr:hypothetical protein OESDEN_06373 [Oesophagostomum dentatum]